MLDQLLEYEEELERGCLSDHLMMVSKKMSVEEGGRALHFLGWVVLPLLDTNQDNVVDRAELLGLQVGRASCCLSHWSTAKAVFSRDDSAANAFKPANTNLQHTHTHTHTVLAEALLLNSPLEAGLF